jgi:hypothetical protein
MFIILLLILFSVLVVFADDREQFQGSYIMPWATRINRPTRNMSYDLRGEEYYPPLLNLPFDNSSIAPIPQPEFADKQGICV